MLKRALIGKLNCFDCVFLRGVSMREDLAVLARICRDQAANCLDRTVKALLLNMAFDYDRRAAGFVSSIERGMHEKNWNVRAGER